MNSLTDLEYRILDELYFVSSFPNLLHILSEEKKSVLDSLQRLLENELVIQMRPGAGVEEKMEVPDFTILEQSFFVASKKGLLIHNSRN